MKKISIILFILSGVVCALVINFHFLKKEVIEIGYYINELQEITTKESEIAEVSPSIFKAAIEYHGLKGKLNTFEWSKTKDRYIFTRNNKEAVIFTKAFWEWYLKNWKKFK